MNELLINYIRPTANSQSTEPVVSFSALVSACKKSYAWKLDIYEIYANVASYLYWNAIRNAQRHGVNSANVAFVERNRTSYVEKPEYVSNRIQSALSKVIRQTTRLNYDLRQHGCALCLNRKLEKDDNGLFKMNDARSIALCIAEAYEQHIGKSILETNWWNEISKM